MNPQSHINVTPAPRPGQSNRDHALRLRGQEIALQSHIETTRIGYKVPSQTGNGSYVVNLEGTPFCTCQDFEKHQQPCKHIYAVGFIVQREEQDDGSRVETQSSRVSYGQNWAAYNAAQVNEQEVFGRLLRELCDTIEQLPQGRGRPRMPLSDMVFAVTTKVFSTMSVRRSMTDMRNATDNGQLDKTPSCTSMFRYLEKAELTPILKSLIEQSALPLRDLEEDYAADSSGFSTNVYDRHFDHKWGKESKRAAPHKQSKWITAHIVCGVKSNIITAAIVKADRSNDTVHLPSLVETTARSFTIRDFSADKAYLSRRNFQAIVDAGGTPYIPFKKDSVAHSSHHKKDSLAILWEKMYHYFHLRREEFLAHYHQRSNVETCFAMIKAKFGQSVRSKTETAQVNEVLAKILCHNIVVLVRMMYTLGINLTFGGVEREVLMLAA